MKNICHTPELSIDEYTKGDSCYAVITSRNSQGSYLELDNGQKAFAFNAGNLKSGVKILCTIIRPQAPGKRALAQLDSICDIYEACA